MKHPFAVFVGALVPPKMTLDWGWWYRANWPKIRCSRVNEFPIDVWMISWETYHQFLIHNPKRRPSKCQLWEKEVTLRFQKPVPFNVKHQPFWCLNQIWILQSDRESWAIVTESSPAKWMNTLWQSQARCVCVVLFSLRDIIPREWVDFSLQFSITYTWRWWFMPISRISQTMQCICEASRLDPLVWLESKTGETQQNEGSWMVDVYTITWWCYTFKWCLSLHGEMI